MVMFSAFFATYAVLSANESANFLILTDTQSNVRRIASVVYAIDSSLAGEQQVKVFHIVHADADKVAQIINSLYGPKQGAAGNSDGTGAGLMAELHVRHRAPEQALRGEYF